MALHEYTDSSASFDVDESCLDGPIKVPLSASVSSSIDDSLRVAMHLISV